MGTDIAGAIECRLPGTDSEMEGRRGWQFAIDLGLLYDERDYDSFGCLFGVENFANFAPIATPQGMPDDASGDVLQAIAEFGEEAFGATWVTWAELNAIDWEEPAEHPDGRIHLYRRDGDELIFESKAAWDRDFATVVGYSITEAVPGRYWWPEGQEWEVAGNVYRSE